MTRFEIKEALMQQNGQAIATVKGSGTSVGITHYQAYDYAPLNGLNYYRINQYDLDGRSNL